MKLRDAGRLVKDAGVKFVDDNASARGAAIAFYSALSLSPLLVIVVAVAGLMFGQEAARGEIVEQLRATTGQEAAAAVEQIVAKSAATPGKGLAAALAFVILLYGASGVFTALQTDLNAIWKVPGKPPAGGGVLHMIRERLLSFSLVCGSAFLLLASLVVSAVLSAVNDRIAGWMPGMTVLAEVLNFVLSVAVLTLLFAMIFRLLPDVHLQWSDVWHGAVITAVLFSVGKYLIGLYLGRAAVGSSYGAAGAFVVLLVWLYYSAQIVLFGAELTFVYAKNFGRSFAAEAARQPAAGPTPAPAH